jgi:fumarate hydratase class II
MVAVPVFGNDHAVAFAGSQGSFQLNAYKPVMLHNVLESAQLLAGGMRSFNARCASGIEPDAKRIKERLDNSLMVVDRAQSAYRLREGRADLAPRLPRGPQAQRRRAQAGFSDGRAIR